MLSKAVRILAIVFIALVVATFANTVFAQTKGFTVRVFPKNEEPMIIEEFTWDGAQFIYGDWRGGIIKLGLKDVKEIHFLGDQYNAMVTMNNGAKDHMNFERSASNPFKGITPFGPWRSELRSISKLEFNP